MNSFLKNKTCTSGVQHAVECDELNKSHTDLGLDIHISPGETSKNPGMKQIANLGLSSLLGNLDNAAVWLRLNIMGEMIRDDLLRKS